DPSSVTVETYPDLSPDMPTMVASAAASSPLTFQVSSHIKEIALGALAVLSLFMVLMAVRKSAPQPAIATAQSEPAPQPPPVIESENLAAEVSGDDGTLEGMELDDDA